MQIVAKRKNLLATYLRSNRVSQATFAGMADISPAYVSQLVHGLRLAELDVALRIEAATGGAVPVGHWRDMRKKRLAHRSNGPATTPPIATGGAR